MSEEKNIMELTDENGNTVEYELLDIVKYNNSTYAVFYPTLPNDSEIVILRVEESDNIDESIYIAEEDEEILREVYDLFKEKYEDEFDFKD